MTLRKKIILTLKEIVHIRVDYTSLPKGRSFIMTTIYPAVFNIITDFITLKIAILINFTDKPLKIRKGIRLNIIYEFVETVYFLTDISKVIIALVIATITFTEPLL